MVKMVGPMNFSKNKATFFSSFQRLKVLPAAENLMPTGADIYFRKMIGPLPNGILPLQPPLCSGINGVRVQE